MDNKQVMALFQRIYDRTFAKEHIPVDVDINTIRLPRDDEHCYEGSNLLHAAALHNNLDAVKLLIDAGIEVNAQTVVSEQEYPGLADIEGTNVTPLMLAAYYGHKDIIEYLLQCGVAIDERQSGLWKRTALHWAALGQKSDIIRLLLQNNADPKIVDDNGMTALHLLTMEHGIIPDSWEDRVYDNIDACVEIAKLLLEAGVDINAQVNEEHEYEGGMTAVMYVVKKTNGASLLKLLLDYEPNLELKGGDEKMSALQYVVAYSRSPEMLEMLIDAGAETEGKEIEDESLIEYAEKERYHEIVTVLRHGSRTKQGMLTRTLFIPRVYEIVRSILSGEVTIPENVQIEIPDLRCIKQWLQNGAVESSGLVYNTYGGEEINIQVIQLLNNLNDIKALLELRKNARFKLEELCNNSVNSQYNNQVRRNIEPSEVYSLRFALRRMVRLAYIYTLKQNQQIQNFMQNKLSSIEQAKLFEKIKAGTFALEDLALADICLNTIYYRGFYDDSVKKGDTLLHAAVRCKNMAAVEMLCDVMAVDVLKAQEHYGVNMTALTLACQERYEEIVMLLLENGADLYVDRQDRKKSLHYAVESGKVNIVELLLNSVGSETDKLVNAQDDEGDTPLMYALGHANPLPMLKILLQYKPDLKLKNKKTCTVLWQAVRNEENIEVIQLLREATPEKCHKEFDDLCKLARKWRRDDIVWALSTPLQRILDRTIFSPLLEDKIKLILSGQAAISKELSINIPVHNLFAVPKFKEDRIFGDDIRLALIRFIDSLISMKQYLTKSEASTLKAYKVSFNALYNIHNNGCAPYLLGSDDVMNIEIMLNNLVNSLKNFMLENSSEKSNDIRLACSAIASGNNFGSPVHHDKGKRKPTDELLPAHTKAPKITQTAQIL